MPVANKYVLPKVLEAATTILRRPAQGNLEYSLVKGVNDREEDIRGLTGSAPQKLPSEPDSGQSGPGTGLSEAHQ